MEEKIIISIDDTDFSEIIGREPESSQEMEWFRESYTEIILNHDQKFANEIKEDFLDRKEYYNTRPPGLRGKERV